MTKSMKTVSPIVIVGLVFLALATLSLGTGSMQIDPSALFSALLGTGDPGTSLIVWSIRLPRLVLAALAGASLALAGAILQGITRNGLADPGILGLTAGAGLAVTGLIWLQSNGIAVEPHWRPAVAFGGAAFAAMITAVAARRDGVIAPVRLLLAGIGMNALIGAATLVIAMGLDRELYSAATVWLSGSLSGAGWSASATLAPWLVILALALAAQTRQLDLLSLDDETAAGRGLAVDRCRLRVAAIAVGLAGAGVAFSGGIGFVGLVAPHMARLMVGPKHALALPLAALCGAAVTVAADLIGRTVFAPVELPAGIVASALGAPWFIWLMWNGKDMKG
ncbi:FecCD family ABC transporter permease [Halomonas llamarensis]|uniref:Iron ABC transporter permease n=1 Tax=Halomonas llamarensis TaxID=2945104 RepID=A0ABT0STP2_9GAMM|nr:iron ABC transporter permease [Halomonas llamarensis]MCL7931210.1 iron ABC transporter permease [Halomonas llamarensis]